ncbi:Rieske (2Fe-2S) protein [Gilvimarinus agarilyticus]|uniref:Rieske (2Fe-2S) protein n=1 Tax=unclassified Gilvimarinus TaxID=2642066 RepID=UPI001C0996D1|nr:MULTISPECIES: Rieske (2Fe-2S) protein [unclassified Gilvimarinus]MBU2887387.1 Rieske (2Fe-2S) protein [Gilvimarinus agarilyticus]MDO6572046.1 Rieske (2Fe-2S) protein [Gilvimarinus sp. 2_MG-2023]MDO6746106.1 Rieske (2Fe-2S) protein [Gilvimarinus sp. 1_MG-2023]
MAYLPLAKLHELYDGYRQSLRIKGVDLLLLQEDGRLLLLLNQCPHQQARLDQATIHGSWLRCPAHGMEFSLDTGRAANPATCQGALQAFPLVYEGNSVGVEVD